MPKISDLPADSAPEGGDLIPFVDTSASRTEQTTITNLAASAAFTAQFAPLNAPDFRQIEAMSSNIPATVSGPTITHNTSATESGLAWRNSPWENVTPLSGGPGAFTYVSAGDYSRYDANYSGVSPWGIEFDYYGDGIDIVYRATSNTTSWRWVWIDGAPTTNAPVEQTGLSSGTSYYINLDFGVAAGPRRVTVYLLNAQLRFLLASATDTVTAAPRTRPRIALIGDSFIEGTADCVGIQGMAFYMGLLLNAEMVCCGAGGTGYVSTGTSGEAYTNADRLAAMAATSPDLVIVYGSVNDKGRAGVEAAALSCYSQIAALLPGVPVVVFGPQATNDTIALSADVLAAIEAVEAAATAAPNVIGFVNQIGITATTTTYAGSTPYSIGDTVTYLGSVWELVGEDRPVSAAAPGLVGYWKRLGLLTGTGRVGATTGNGNRDVLLASDDVHPTVAGGRMHASFLARLLIDVLRGT